MNIKQSKKIIISLSKPAKMPGYAYGLPAWECKTGAKLVKVPGSVCAGCYALKGNYARYPEIKKSQYMFFLFASHIAITSSIIASLSSIYPSYNFPVDLSSL